MGVPAEIPPVCRVSFPLLPIYRDNFSMLSKNLSYRDFQLVEYTDLTAHSPLTNEVHHPIHPNPRKIEMVYWICAAVVFIYVRKFVERNILQPLGTQLGVKENSRTKAHLPCSSDSSAVLKLEKAYISSVPKPLNHEQVKLLSNDTGLETRIIERWLRRRAAADKPSDLIKFMESGWRLICYISSTSFGIIVLWDKPWLWDITESWKDYPHHGISNEIWWYYLFGAGQYISVLITLTSDVKRKDYWEMCVHHCITISLLAISWTSKMANYTKRNHLATGVFLIFTFVWIVTRLVIFPHQVIFRFLESGYSTGVLSLYGMVVILCLFLMLFGLHIFWTYFIIKIVRSSISSPENFKDARSSSEEESSKAEIQETDFKNTM